MVLLQVRVKLSNASIEIGGVAAAAAVAVAIAEMHFADMHDDGFRAWRESRGGRAPAKTPNPGTVFDGSSPVAMYCRLPKGGVCAVFRMSRPF